MNTNITVFSNNGDYLSTVSIEPVMRDNEAKEYLAEIGESVAIRDCTIVHSAYNPEIVFDIVLHLA